MTFFLIPILVGAFGWFIVWALVKLVFYPTQAIEIGPFKWESLANKWVHQIDLSELIPQLTHNDSFETLKPIMNEKLDDFFRHKLSVKLPMISMFIGDKTIEELKGVFMEELAILFPLLITQFSSNLNKAVQQQWQLKFRNIVFNKITKATTPLKWLAFVLGFFLGWVIAAILPLI
ncbi:MAG: hypothetical protein ACKOWO_04090 [Sediminibacterium sp.]